MPPLALGLVLLSAFIHAFWNYLAKTSRDALPFFWWALLVSGLGYLPVFLFTWGAAPFPPAAWFCLLGASAFQAAYFISLARAYATGDLSLVYPVARSFPLVVPLWAFLFLGERLSGMGLAGIVVIVAGCFLLSARRDQAGPPGAAGKVRLLEEVKRPAYRWALVTALVSSGYTVVDKVAVALVNPIPYLYLCFWAVWLMMSFYLLATRRTALLAPAWRREWRRIVPCGLLFTLTYCLVLFAARISPISYVAALRQISIVFAVLLGALTMREGLPGLRLAAALIICLGAALISVYG